MYRSDLLLAIKMEKQEEKQHELSSQNRDFFIEFKKLCYSVHEKKGKHKSLKCILHNLNGKFYSGHLTAILGPSGAGKSTLLNILSGLRACDRGGSIIVSGQEQNLQQMKRISRYITQEFALLPLLTTRETLMIAINLKLSTNVGIWKKNSIVNEIIELLGLQKVMHTSVGKLSGGEKKRLSIGVELLTNPPIMFFDEPTSGLDSSSSYQIITHLKSLAQGGRIIVCAIHQPSSRLFEMFDDLFLLGDGQCFYSGPIKNMTDVFEKAGFQCPRFYNRADFAIEIVSGERGDSAGNLINKENNKFYIQNTEDQQDSPDNVSEKTSMLPAITSMNFNETTIQVSPEKTCNVGCNSQVQLHTQFFILLKRSLQCTVRDLHMTRLRLFAHFIVGLLLGAIYYGMGNDASKMSSNAACIFFFIMFLFFSNAMPTVHTFPVEASVFHREYLNNWYSLPAYYFSKLVAEVPLQIICPSIFICCGYFLTHQPYDGMRILQFWVICILLTILGQTMGLAIGAAFDAQLGIFLVPASSIPMILFSGFFLKLQDVPSYLQWLSYLSYFRYAFEGSMISVYGSVYGNNRPDLVCSVPFCYFKSPARILEEFGIEESSLWTDITGLLVWIIGLQILLFIILKWRLKLQ